MAIGLGQVIMAAMTMTGKRHYYTTPRRGAAVVYRRTDHILNDCISVKRDRCYGFFFSYDRTRRKDARSGPVTFRRPYNDSNWITFSKARSLFTVGPRSTGPASRRTRTCYGIRYEFSRLISGKNYRVCGFCSRSAYSKMTSAIFSYDALFTDFWNSIQIILKKKKYETKPWKINEQ